MVTHIKACSFSKSALSSFIWDNGNNLLLHDLFQVLHFLLSAVRNLFIKESLIIILDIKMEIGWY